MNKEGNWKEAIRLKRFRLHLLVSGIGAVFLISFLPYFFNAILQSKPGVLLNDWVLARFEPTDWSWIIFTIIYSCVLLFVAFNYARPFVILLAVESYLAINLVRIATLYCITLEPPQGIIPLVDPLVTKVAYGGSVYLKDLFFSGHVSTLFLLVMTEKNKIRKMVLLVATILVGLLILWQHVHYTVDVFFAPIFTLSIYYVLRKFHGRQFRPNI